MSLVLIAIDIPDEIGTALAAQAGGASRAALEAVAIEAHRSGTITTSQVQQILGLNSPWKTEELLQSAKAFQGCTIDDLDKDIAAIRGASLK